jgi:ubiquitin conjugation factor E4 B
MLLNNPRDELIAFSMIMLSNSSYIKNPYLKSKLIEILFYFTLPLYKSNDVPVYGLEGVLMTHPMAKSHLVSSVLHWYTGILNCLL